MFMKNDSPEFAPPARGHHLKIRFQPPCYYPSRVIVI
jgi:hypothetical protein